MSQSSLLVQHELCKFERMCPNSLYLSGRTQSLAHRSEYPPILSLLLERTAASLYSMVRPYARVAEPSVVDHQLPKLPTL